MEAIDLHNLGLAWPEIVTTYKAEEYVWKEGGTKSRETKLCNVYFLGSTCRTFATRSNQYIDIEQCFHLRSLDPYPSV